MNERVLIIGDHTLFCAGLRGLLTCRNFDVVTVVIDDLENIKITSKNSFDVVLLVMRMQQMAVVNVLKTLEETHPDSPVAILATKNDESNLLGNLRSGVKNFLLNDMEPEELVLALRKIVVGKSLVATEPKTVNENTVIIDDMDGKSAEIYNPFTVLSRRELEVVPLIAQGQSNKVIARNLNITDATVKLHVRGILRKLNVDSRIKIAVMAVEYGVKKKENTKSSLKE